MQDFKAGTRVIAASLQIVKGDNGSSLMCNIPGKDECLVPFTGTTEAITRKYISWAMLLWSINIANEELVIVAKLVLEEVPYLLTSPYLDHLLTLLVTMYSPEYLFARIHLLLYEDNSKGIRENNTYHLEFTTMARTSPIYQRLVGTGSCKVQTLLPKELKHLTPLIDRSFTFKDTIFAYIPIPEDDKVGRAILSDILSGVEGTRVSGIVTQWQNIIDNKIVSVVPHEFRAIFAIILALFEVE